MGIINLWFKQRKEKKCILMNKSFSTCILIWVWWGMNHLDGLADENDAAQATIFDERLAKILKTEIRSKVLWSYFLKPRQRSI